MNEQFVPYEIALKLKEKGFDEPCFADFFFFEDGNVVLDRDEDRECIITQNPEENITKCLAPLWQQVIDWFEDKFNLKFSIAYWNGYNDFLPKEMQYKYEVFIIPENAPSIIVRGDKGSYFLYRKDAITAAILKALTLI